MSRMRFLRAAVHLRRWQRRPMVAQRLARIRRGVPFASSALLNFALIFCLALGYSSFVAKGVPGAGLGERVISVRFFDMPEPDTVAPEIQAEDTEAPEDAEVGTYTIREGNDVETGEDTGELEGDNPPEEDEGEQTTAARLGVSVPSIALPEIDAGAGRPDGVIGVDCYRIFRSDRDKALECAGREILSGWRAEIASLGQDWDRFADELGTDRRQIRYGPLRAPLDPQRFGYPSGLAVPKEVRQEYEAALIELRRRQAIEEYGRSREVEEELTRERERDQDAATYNPVSPGGS